MERLGSAIVAFVDPVGLSEGATTSGEHLVFRQDVQAGTDVTGFGLLGHLYKMARASGVTAVVDAASVPYLTGARQAVADGYVSGGTRRNLDWVRPHADLSAAGEDEALLLADAQTSGGLLLGGEVPGAPVIGEFVPRRETVVVLR